MINIFKLLGKYKKYAILTPILIIFEVFVDISIPFLMSKIVNKISTNEITIKYILHVGFFMICLTVFGCSMGVLAAKCSAIASVGFAKNIRQEIFNKIQDFSFSNINKFSTSSLITRLTTDVNNIQNAFMITIRGAIRAPFMLVGAAIMAILTNKELSLIFLLTIPLLTISLYFVQRTAHPRFNILLKKYDDLNLKIQENLIGIRVVKSFVKEDYENKKFQNEANDLKKAQIFAEKIVVLNMPILQFIIYFSIICVLWFGSKLIFNNKIEIGQLASFLTYNFQILFSLMMLSFIFISLILSKTSIKRICEILDEEIDIKDSETDLYFLDSSIEFKNVSFSYTKNKDNLVLKNINLDIKSGESVGIIGSTGSGKTTLVQLLPRLYDVFSGELFIGKNSIKKYKLKTLRDSIAMVLQKNTLFSGTIKENILWGKESATEEEIVEFCKKAEAHDFIMSFPEKYETKLGQSGVNISGGQKQRLCIARALLKQPKILILDDSLSAIDTVTEAKIRQNLNELNMTKIIVSQRILSIKNCDKIVVVDSGEINGIGTHQELLENNSIYKEIYYSQQNGLLE